MKKVAVLGLGYFGQVMATELARRGVEVLALDRDRLVVDAIKDSVSLAVACDVIDVELLKNFGVGSSYDAVIITMGHAFEAAQLALLAAQEAGARKVIVRTSDPIRKEIMRRLGASNIIDPEEAAAHSLVRDLVRGDLARAIDLGEGVEVLELPATPRIVGRTLIALDLRRRWHLNLVAIKTRVAEVESDAAATSDKKKPAEGAAEGEEPVGAVEKPEVMDQPAGARVDNIPLPDRVFTELDTLVLVGRSDDLDAFYDSVKA